MENKKEVVFVDGMIFKKPKEGTPDFVKGKISIKCGDFVRFMDAHSKNGWLNIDLLKSQRTGGLYFQLDNWEKPESSLTPEEKQAIIDMKKANNEQVADINPEDIPF